MKTIHYLIVTGIFFLAALGYTTAHADDFTDTIHMFKNSPIVFVYAKGRMMFEATVGGQTFLFEPR